MTGVAETPEGLRDSPSYRSAGWVALLGRRHTRRDLRKRVRTWHRAAVLGAILMLAGCATYQPLSLAEHARLAPGLGDLHTRVVVPGRPPQRIDVHRPLDVAEVGLLAVLNDPDLRSEWGTIGIAKAGLLQTSLLPNPSASLGFAAVLGGPGTATAFAASLSQDIASLVTYRTRVHAARAHVGEVNAALLWQEWQVAQKARLLALDIYYGERSLALTKRELALVSSEVQQARAAAASGNLALVALAPLLAAEASAGRAMVALHIAQIKQWQSLNGLLGLEPSVRFAIAKPSLDLPLVQSNRLISQLSSKRPDLVALRLGYESAEAKLRAAVLGQFPVFLLGGSWGSDTTAVRSAGPTVTFELPIFNHDQGKLSEASATWLLLHEQYLARLDSATGTARGILRQERVLARDLPQAHQAAQGAENLAQTARGAYAQGNLDQRTLTDYETTALQRSLEVLSLERLIGEDRIAFDVEVGRGLPMTRIVPHDRARSE